jgi:hypothetical protein
MPPHSKTLSRQRQAAPNYGRVGIEPEAQRYRSSQRDDPTNGSGGHAAARPCHSGGRLATVRLRCGRAPAGRRDAEKNRGQRTEVGGRGTESRKQTRISRISRISRMNTDKKAASCRRTPRRYRGRGKPHPITDGVELSQRLNATGHRSAMSLPTMFGTRVEVLADGQRDAEKTGVRGQKPEDGASKSRNLESRKQK